MAFAAAPALPHVRVALRSRSARAVRPRVRCAAPAPQGASLSEGVDALRVARGADAAAPPVVHLVGTGPGDAGLLTLRAVELMRTADVVLYDRLVSDEILAYVNDAATMIYVGKEAGFHTRSQEDIHVLLSSFATVGKTVIRLKGGDPFVFGRGGEETEFLEQQGIEVRAVPGITAASGIGAELGIPLTHRGIAHSVRFLTGHVRDGASLDLGSVDPATTLVVYMGLGQLPDLVADLAARGLSTDTPAVAVERGTTSQQRVVWGRVATLADRVQHAHLRSPTLIIIGDVVRLARGWDLHDLEAHDLSITEGLASESSGAPTIAATRTSAM